MKDNFEYGLDHVLENEGGWSDHRDDPGGATMKGVTLITFRRFYGLDREKADLRQITREQLSHIYRAGYWDACKCDELPSGVDLTVFDGAVNSGPGRSARWLQAAVGAIQDGAIGPETLSQTQSLDPALIINGVSNLRLDFLMALDTWDVFGQGWQRRVERLRADSLQLALGIGPDTDFNDPADIFETTRKGSEGEWVKKLQNALGIKWTASSAARLRPP